MTDELLGPEPFHKIWFRKEQGRFLKEARLRAGMSVWDVARRTGVDIRWVESGEVSLRLRNLSFLVRLYRVPDTDFICWERRVSIRIRQMAPPRLLH